MDINTIQGMNTYAAFNTTKADEGLVRTNQEAETTNTSIESIQTVQEAFQVDITQEALAMQAENTENLPTEEIAATAQTETNQVETDLAETGGTKVKQPPQASFSQGQTQQVSQLVDILA